MLLTIALAVQGLVLPVAFAQDGQAGSNTVDARRAAAVAQARAGQLDHAFTQLAELHARYPADLTITFDFAVVASWMGKDQDAVDALADIDLAALPAYVRQPYAKSLRNLKLWSRALTVYTLLEQDAAYQPGAAFGTILTLADAGQTELAADKLANLERADFSEDELLQYYFSCGYVRERGRDFVSALDCYNLGLRIDPEHQELKRRRVIVASALGATKFASGEVAQAPGLVTAEERAQIELDADAMLIRWAGLSSGLERRQEMRDLLQRRQQRDPLLTDTQRRVLLYDEIVAHVAIAQMEQALAKARLLRAQGVSREDLPAYVLESLGFAYMYLEDPDAAIALFRLALEKIPVQGAAKQRFRTSVGLFYALSDGERFAEVTELVTELKAAEQAWERPTPRIWLENDRYTDSLHLAVLAKAYREQYDAALHELDELLALAPANNDLRLTRAAITRWRGWYRQSEHELGRVDSSDPLLARWVQMAHLKLATQHFSAAQEALEKARLIDPLDKAVVDAAQRWQHHNQPAWEISTTSARSDGGQLGNESYQLDATVFSAPLRENYRLFARDRVRYAEFSEGVGRDHRLGGGLEYRDGAWTATAGIHTGLEQNDDAGTDVSLSWRPDDYWQHSAELQLNSIETPLRGTRQGVKGDLLTLRTAYRWHESRQADLQVAALDLSDGNQRQSLNLSYRQRVLNWPRHKIAVLTGFYTSRNDSDNVAYFSPRNDRDLGADLEHEWRPWRRYDRAFVQRFTVGLGSYQQDGFGSDGRWQATLEHEWQLGDGLSLSYGGSVGRRPYDGVQEKQRSVFLTVRGLL
ncbi:MAG: poly-beta-1,6 N-acetyl-D-glucosamine export porin PgaA [Pseudomonadales bacterium]